MAAGAKANIVQSRYKRNTEAVVFHHALEIFHTDSDFISKTKLGNHSRLFSKKLYLYLARIFNYFSHEATSSCFLARFEHSNFICGRQTDGHTGSSFGKFEGFSDDKLL